MTSSSLPKFTVPQTVLGLSKDHQYPIFELAWLTNNKDPAVPTAQSYAHLLGRKSHCKWCIYSQENALQMAALINPPKATFCSIVCYGTMLKYIQSVLTTGLNKLKNCVGASRALTPFALALPCRTGQRQEKCRAAIGSLFGSPFAHRRAQAQLR